MITVLEQDGGEGSAELCCLYMFVYVREDFVCVCLGNIVLCMWKGDKVFVK